MTEATPTASASTVGPRSEEGGAGGEDRAPAPRARSFQVIDGLLLAATLVMAFLLTRQAWVDFYQAAMSRDEYGHILFVPFGIAGLVWVRRARLRRCKLEHPWVGLPLVVVGLGVSRLGDTHMVNVSVHVGALLAVAGCVVACFGTRVALRLLPAFGAGVFLLPWPGVLLGPVSLFLQHASAVAAEGLLVMLGADVTRTGNVLNLNGQQVAVADACSGISVLFPTLFVVYVIVFARPLPLWLRGAVFVLTVPLVFVVNALRLVPTAYAYGHLSAETADGVHDALGWGVIVVVSVLVAFAVGQIEPVAPRGKNIFRRSGGDKRGEGRSLRERHARAWLCAMLFLLSFFAVAFRPTPLEAAPLLARAEVSAAIAALPESIHGWQGVEVDAPIGLEMLDPELVWSRAYASPGLSGGHFQILLVQVPDPRKLVGHSVEVCYPSHGFAGTAQRRTVSWGDAGVPRGRTADVVQLPLAGRSAVEPSIVVESFWLLATGDIGIDPSLLRAAIADRSSRPRGAIMAQLVFPGHLAPDVREALTRETLALLDHRVLPVLSSTHLPATRLDPNDE